MTEQTESLQSLLDAATAWAHDDVDDVDKAELHALVERARATAPGAVQARAELQDRFAARLQFGTAGLRGAMAAGPNRMNRSVVIGAAAGLGAYLGSALGAASGATPPRVVVGFDARHRSADFARDTAAVLTAQGAEVLVLPSPLPTPVLSFAVRHLSADAGVMVTASHNPAADNGYKVYLGGRVVTDAGQGAQIVPPYDVLIAEQIAAVGPAAAVPRAESGWTTLDASIVDDYVAATLALADETPRTLRIVTTSLHGVGGQVLARVLAEAGFTHVVPVEEQRRPDPDFPTVVFPNPEEKGAIDMAVAVAQDAHADIVIANDPDADRCAVAVHDRRQGTYQGAETATSQGWRMLHGDEVGALLGDDIASRLAGTFDGAQDRPVLANSVVSSRLLAAIAHRHGLAHATTLTGFKWIARTPALAFGYEEALGYCVDPDQVRDKDGISAALLVAQLANRLKAAGRTLPDRLDDLAREHGLYLTDQLSVRFEDLAGIPAAMARLRAEPPTTLAGSGVVDVLDLADGVDGLPPTDGVRLLTQDGTRVIVRPSGTEPKVKCYLEVVRDVPADATFEEISRARSNARATLAMLKHDIAAALGL
ncbi:phosphoglucomutase/phosphomannomutase alpha/beta/alpha domain I [Xylanimonas cellulosilytica DSM 15894]|uniref:Phosphoglucomutase/phosphomannomutase alpha/beta/alpha domain I n=1 Tax=Xylanimonas cellulosilytica (strain DSM 15894 / JCM 12276 / CECT 5975 / KCTC 9989 / LMG 20990 / NBRC 107835 / XIL07) TaxID=446471 RepID=D1BYW1_XYLCX|nr:phospho-sugar mutase [Xylanimonas cellulosilytica]ACZ30036.1 phosphoglucomutase/phosphomannomutase alpha/beta/alpha domain I [Xylanimonas cellulosilytica DSM 15894]